jgi:two-component system sensor histidine kinase KdpD
MGMEDIHAALIATVSHDLRTPLATAHTSLAQMSRLIEGLLSVGRVQHGANAVRLLPTRLADVARAAVAGIPGGQHLTIDVPPGLPDVITDPMLLERVIANVVANALRCSPPGTPARLVADRQGCRVELRVIDRGPGVPPTRWKDLFQPFEQLGDAHSAAGLGLGLAIANALADAIGASLIPEMTDGGGLTMIIALPSSDQPRCPL